jgi:hypothetical protein
MSLFPGQFKPKTKEWVLNFVASPLSKQHKGIRQVISKLEWHVQVVCHVYKLLFQ